MFSFNVIQLLYTLPALLLALIFHEFSHGFIAYKLGDMSAKEQGRLTLNPMKHIDPVGFFMFLFFRFGWAKPVPYNPYYFKNRKLGTLLVALAGPLSNFILAFISILIIFLIQSSNILVLNFLNSLFLYNIMFGVFNLIPIPPLDGLKIIASIIPVKYENIFWRYERFGYPILIILVITGQLSVILVPIINILMEKLIYLASIFF